MFKKAAIYLYLIFFILITPFLFYIILQNSSLLYSQAMSTGEQKVIYELPYPGILPDHPLYLIKALRDKMMDLSTRDNIKKAELYLLLSDKRINMALQLSKKGKTKLFLTTLSKGEKYFYKIPDLLITAKKQGSGSNSSFINKLKLSNEKHKEVIDSLIKELPVGEEKQISHIIDLNKKIKELLEKL